MSQWALVSLSTKRYNKSDFTMESSQVWHPSETNSTISDISSCAAWHRFKTAQAYHQPACEGAQQQAKQHHPPAYQDLAQAVSPHCQRSVPYTFQAKANTQIHQGLTTICKQLKATMWNQHVTHAQADATAGSCNNPPFSLCLAPSMFPKLHWASHPSVSGSSVADKSRKDSSVSLV